MAPTGYESLGANNADHHSPTGSNDDFETIYHPDRHEDRYDDTDSLAFSEDEDDANVKLLPMSAKGTTNQRQFQRDARADSPSDDGNLESMNNDDPHDVGPRIEHLLQKDQTERRLLAESFNLNPGEADSTHALSDADSDDYGFPNKTPYTDDEAKSNLRSRIRTVVRERPWWQIVILFVIGIALMWGTASGLRGAYRRFRPRREFVRLSCFGHNG